MMQALSSTLFLLLCVGYSRADLWSINSSLVEPCTIIPPYIVQCTAPDRTTNEDLARVFNALHRELEPWERHLGNLHLKDSLVTELGPNAFQDITFDYIELSGNDTLTRVHQDAFMGTKNVTTMLVIGPNKQFNATRKTLSVVKQFKLLKEVQINFGNADIDILENSFAGLTKLESISLTSVKPAKGQLAEFWPYSFNGLESIGMIKILSPITVDKFPDYTFALIDKTSEYLTLEVDIPNIESAFSEKSLLGINRATSLKLFSLPRYLNETVFRAFLSDHPANTIDIGFYDERAPWGEPQLNCSDCRNLWIAKEHNIQKRIFNSPCDWSKFKC